MQMKNALATLAGLVAAGDAFRGNPLPNTELVARQRGGFGGFGGFGGNGQGNGGGNNNANNANNANNNNDLCLNPNNVQAASNANGQNGNNVAAGQTASNTDPANFINFCEGQTLTDGTQNRGGSCNGIVMGRIPAANQMVSTVITNPQNGQVVEEGQTFNVDVNIANMELGVFTNPDNTYYSAPQDLNNQGAIIGHTHVTIQDAGGSLNPQQPLDASQFVFFKGINDAGNGQGQLQAVVDGGLPAGFYRVCTLAGSANHQPVLMPVAQRGAQDDCRYFQVGNANGGGNNGAANGAGNGGGNGGRGRFGRPRQARD